MTSCVHFDIQKSWGLPLPKWYQQQWVQDRIAKFVDAGYRVQSANDVMKKYGGGAFIHVFLKNIERKEKKLYLYAGHESNIDAVARALGISDVMHYPRYTDGIIFESYRHKKTGELYVRVFSI